VPKAAEIREINKGSELEFGYVFLPPLRENLKSELGKEAKGGVMYLRKKKEVGAKENIS